MDRYEYWGRFGLGVRALNCVLQTRVRTKEELLALGQHGFASTANAGDKTVNEVWELVFGVTTYYRKTYHSASDTRRGTKTYHSASDTRRSMIVKTPCPTCGHIVSKRMPKPRQRHKQGLYALNSQ